MNVSVLTVDDKQEFDDSVALIVDFKNGCKRRQPRIFFSAFLSDESFHLSCNMHALK